MLWTGGARAHPGHLTLTLQKVTRCQCSRRTLSVSADGRSEDGRGPAGRGRSVTSPGQGEGIVGGRRVERGFGDDRDQFDRGQRDHDESGRRLDRTAELEDGVRVCVCRFPAGDPRMRVPEIGRRDVVVSVVV